MGRSRMARSIRRRLSDLCCVGLAARSTAMVETGDPSGAKIVNIHGASWRLASGAWLGSRSAGAEIPSAMRNPRLILAGVLRQAVDQW